MLGAILSAGSSILGGLLGKSSADKQAKLQKEFAQNGIQWKVKDATKAGIHPLYALGANTVSYSPVQTGDLGTGIANAGQDIGRAVDATATTSQRQSGLQSKMDQLALQRAGLENELLASQIARTRGAAVGPPMPSADSPALLDGQGNTNIPVAGMYPAGLPLVNYKPMDSTATISSGTQEPTSVADTGYLKTPTGMAPVYSNDAKQRLEDDFLGMLSWNARNRLAASLGYGGNPPAGPRPPGTRWEYDILNQEYVLVKKDGSGLYKP